MPAGGVKGSLDKTNKPFLHERWLRAMRLSPEGASFFSLSLSLACTYVFTHFLRVLAEDVSAVPRSRHVCCGRLSAHEPEYGVEDVR